MDSPFKPGHAQAYSKAKTPKPMEFQKKGEKIDPEKLSLSDWITFYKIRTHFSRTITCAPWCAWVGDSSVYKHFDIHGPEGFVYANTKTEALKKVCTRKGIKPHESLMRNA